MIHLCKGSWQLLSSSIEEKKMKNSARNKVRNFPDWIPQKTGSDFLNIVIFLWKGLWCLIRNRIYWTTSLEYQQSCGPVFSKQWCWSRPHKTMRTQLLMFTKDISESQNFSLVCRIELTLSTSHIFLFIDTFLCGVFTLNFQHKLSPEMALIKSHVNLKLINVYVTSNAFLI